MRAELASDWQAEYGFSYDGVPELGGRLNNFTIRCAAVNYFQQATYSFSTSSSNVYVRVTVDSDSHVLSRMSDWTEPPWVITKIFASSGHVQIVVDICKKNPPTLWKPPKLREERAYVIFTAVKIHWYDTHIDFSPAEEAACLSTPTCYGKGASCHKFFSTDNFSSTEMEWQLCVPWFRRALELSKQRCLVYSVGIRRAHGTEDMYGALGCEVFAFDCTSTVLNRSLAPNVTFYPWCVGTEDLELNIGDGAVLKGRSSGIFKTLPEIMKELGHTERQLTILKMDCEGCEWGGIAQLEEAYPTMFSHIAMVFLELHWVRNPAKPEIQEIADQAKVSKLMRHFLVHHFHVNADVSMARQKNYPTSEELRKVGLGSPFHEVTFVNREVQPPK